MHVRDKGAPEQEHHNSDKTNYSEDSINTDNVRHSLARIYLFRRVVSLLLNSLATKFGYLLESVYRQ